MSTASASTATETTVMRQKQRVVSIDIFRGLTMAVMIFVNALPESAGLPWWTYHAHMQQDLMTYVDMVFPFFLFIVGMSMPLSVEQRLKKNPSQAALWWHVVTRSLGLIVLGLILANADFVDAKLTGMKGDLWALLGLICCGLYLNVYPKSERFPRYSTVLRGIGLVGVVVLYAIFRRVTKSGEVAWLEFGYPEILGLIGYSYLAAAVLFIPTRKSRWAALTWCAVMVLFCAGCTAKMLPMFEHAHWWFWPFTNGSMVALIMAGAATSQFFLGVIPGKGERPAAKSATVKAIVFAAVMLAAGWMSTPLGISKIRATPSWTLWCAGDAVLLFVLLYWICDVWGKTGWAWLLRPAGANTLTTYLLPDLFDFGVGITGFTWYYTHFGTGWEAVVKTVIFTICILLASMVLTRARVRLQL
jgi:predicted acyltransferase